MKLYICEKRSQAQDIASVLGITSRASSHFETRDGTVTWAIGHLLQLAEPEEYDASYGRWSYDHLPIIPSSFRVRPNPKTKDQLRAVKALIGKASSIVIATDADKEGEMIARELLEHTHYRGDITRLWLSALDPESIRKALDRIRKGSETESLYFAALARSQSDWLVGMNMSRALTLRCRKPGESNGFISVGRVQTPTLALVVRRDREIENFIPRDYFEISAAVSADDGLAVTLKHAPVGDERIFERARAEAIATSASGVRGPISVEKEMKRKSPPKLFALSTFQVRANALFGWTADDSLKIAQSLYETHKVTTYPRTDCEFLPEEQIPDIGAIVSNLRDLSDFSNLPTFETTVRKSVFNTAKVTAHHAIIPTKVKPNLSNMSDDERKGFLLIARSYLAALMPDYEYENTRMSMMAGETEFSATGNVPKVQGWKLAYGDADDSDSSSSTLPPILDGTAGVIEQATVEAKKTEPPNRYTEGTLILDMKSVAKFVTDPSQKERLKETSGIGTEATRANIIKTLRDPRRGFIEAKGKKLISTSKGRALIDLLQQHLPALADPGETAVWEDGLESIVEGKMPHSRFVAGIGTRIGEYISTLSGAVAAPPDAPAFERERAEVKATPHTYREKPVLDGGSRWIFEAVKGHFPKVLAKRNMSVDDYIRVLDAPADALAEFEGFVSKTGKSFSAPVKFNSRKKYQGRPSPGIEFAFER